MTLDLWKDILSSILKTKNHVLLDPENERDYKPFAINRAVSRYKDAIFHINELNLNHQLDSRMQYDYLFHSLKAFKREFMKKEEKEKIEYLENIRLFYNCSLNRAKEIISVLTEDQLDEIMKRTTIGGKVGSKNKDL